AFSFSRPIVALTRSGKCQSIAMFSALQPSPPTCAIVRLASSTAFTSPAAAKATDLGKALEVKAVQHAATVSRTLWPRASLLYPDDRATPSNNCQSLPSPVLRAAARGQRGRLREAHVQPARHARGLVHRGSGLARRSAALGPARLAGPDIGMASSIRAGPL